MYSNLGILIISIFAQCVTSDSSNETSFQERYHSGVEAYLDERWEDCINDLEAAIRAWKMRLTAISDCRIRCQRKPFKPMEFNDIDDLHFYEKSVKRTLCFIKCKRVHFKDVAFNVLSDSSILKIMEDLKPYSYLHICYFSKDLFQKAASAAYTYLAHHPDDKTMKLNVEFYLQQPNVDQEEVTNYEIEEYLPLYAHGMNAYNNKDWEAVNAYMEESLQAYYAAEEKCRVLCEGSFDQGWLPDFLTSISNHFTFCLKCKQKCAEKLKPQGGLEGRELLADIYNYLQIANYKLGRMPQACRAVGSYLMVHPDSQEILHNKKLYSKNCDDNLFKPSPDMSFYIKRDNYEKKILDFISTEFTKEFNTGKEEREKESSNKL